MDGARTQHNSTQHNSTGTPTPGHGDGEKAEPISPALELVAKCEGYTKNLMLTSKDVVIAGEWAAMGATPDMIKPVLEAGLKLFKERCPDRGMPDHLSWYTEGLRIEIARRRVAGIQPRAPDAPPAKPLAGVASVLAAQGLDISGLLQDEGDAS